MEFGTKLDNGGIVIEATKTQHTAGLYIVLARYNGEFATWWVKSPKLTAECGHYHDNITEATQDYANRCQLDFRA